MMQYYIDPVLSCGTVQLPKSLEQNKAIKTHAMKFVGENHLLSCRLKQLAVCVQRQIDPLLRVCRLSRGARGWMIRPCAPVHGP